MESSIVFNKFEENDIKPMEYAIRHFGTFPSLFILKDVIMSQKAYEAFMLTFNGDVRKEFEVTESDIMDNLKEANLMSDRFVTAVNIKENFYESYEKPTNIDTDSVVISFSTTEDIYKLFSIKKTKIIGRLTIYYKDRSALSNFLEVLSKEIKIDQDKVIDHNSYINLVIRRPSGSFDTSNFAIKNPKINIPLAYGEEFAPIDKNIFSSLIKSDKGLWVFHGPPGTGKSMYIRHTIKKLNKSGKVGDIIYMPSEMVGSLESPDFIPFIQDYQDSILVIEDADLALESRKNHGSIVKTVLQLTDGILADCLRLKIIATFNCELEKIDEALLRKGRLQYRHEFRNLSREEAIKLATSLKIDTSFFENEDNRNKKDWTLAEIYNIQTDFHWEKKKKRLGF